MSQGGWYLDNQMYNNKFTSVSLHYNTVLREVERTITKTDIKNGFLINSNLAVTQIKDKPDSAKYNKLEWRRLGGDTIKFLDPLGNRLGVAIGDADTIPYDEEGYSVDPLLCSIMQDDFNVTITNEYTDFGDDPMGNVWNMYKTSIPTSRFMSKIFSIMKANQSNLTKEQEERIQSSFIGRALMSIVELNNANGSMTAFQKYQNANLMCQGNRFTFYNGTGINFGTLGMKITIFPKWEFKDKKCRFKTVNAQLDEIFPYVVGNIEPVDLETLDSFLNSLKDSFGLNKNNDTTAIEASIKELVGEYAKFQLPPACYEPDLKHIDNINKGTLKLKIGPYYSISDLVITDMSLNYSKYMVKNPVAGIADGTVKSTIMGNYEQDTIYSPLYCEVNLSLKPVSKFTSDRLKQFASGAWRKMDISYLNKKMEENIQTEISNSVKKYNPNPQVTNIRKQIDDIINKETNTLNTKIESEEEFQIKCDEVETELRSYFNSLPQKDREEFINSINTELINYLPKETVDEMSGITDTGDGHTSDYITALAYVTASNGKSIDLTKLNQNPTILNEVAKQAYVNELLITRQIDSRQHALDNIEYIATQKAKQKERANEVKVLADLVFNFKTGVSYKVSDDGSQITVNGVNIPASEFVNGQRILASEAIKNTNDELGYNSAIKEVINSYDKLSSDIANLEKAKEFTDHYESRTIESITADVNADYLVENFLEQSNLLISNNDAEKTLILAAYSDNYSIESLENAKTSLEQRQSKLNQQVIEKTATVDDIKAKILGQILSNPKNPILSTKTLLNSGWINKNGSITPEFKKATIADIYEVIENEDYSKYTSEEQAACNQARQQLMENQTIGYEIALQADYDLYTISTENSKITNAANTLDIYLQDRKKLNEMITNAEKYANEHMEGDYTDSELHEAISSSLQDEFNRTGFEYKST